MTITERVGRVVVVTGAGSDSAAQWPEVYSMQDTTLYWLVETA